MNQYDGYKKTEHGVIIHPQSDFDGMRRAGRLAKSVLDYISQFVKVGVSTGELNDLCHKYILDNNAIPAPLNYKGFPKSICTSVNHVVCHGIPSYDHLLKDGDILNIDVTVIVDGYYGDTSRMYTVGRGTVVGDRLIKCTYDAMMAGIAAARPKNTIRDIAIAIEDVVKQYGYSCVREFCGHGIGKIFHGEPQIMHCNDKTSEYQDMIIEPGMFFTIEPMVNAGDWRTIVSKFDGWTATTRDKKPSAQFEHTLAITDDGNEVFTI